MGRGLDAAALGVLLFVGQSAPAAIQQIDSAGILTGATGVSVGGLSYDVAFRLGTCISNFVGCDQVADFDFNNSTDALLAGQALLDQVLLDSPSGAFDSQPSMVFGCDGATTAGVGCSFLIPYGFSTTHLLFGRAFNYPSPFNYLDTVQLSIGQPDTQTDSLRVYADWTRVAPVPLPAAAWLLLSGLGGLGFLGRRRKAA